MDNIRTTGDIWDTRIIMVKFYNLKDKNLFIEKIIFLDLDELRFSASSTCF